MMNNQYISGIIGYNLKGVRGEPGSPGYSVFFTNLKGSIDITNVIKSNGSLISSISVPYEPGYKTGDYIISNTNDVYVIDKTFTAIRLDKLNIADMFRSSEIQTEDGFLRFVNNYGLFVDNIKTTDHISLDSTNKVYGQYVTTDFMKVIYNDYKYMSGDMNYTPLYSCGSVDSNLSILYGKSNISTDKYIIYSPDELKMLDIRQSDDLKDPVRKLNINVSNGYQHIYKKMLGTYEPVFPRDIVDFDILSHILPSNNGIVRGMNMISINLNAYLSKEILMSENANLLDNLLVNIVMYDESKYDGVVFSIEYTENSWNIPRNFIIPDIPVIIDKILYIKYNESVVRKDIYLEFVDRRTGLKRSTKPRKITL